MTTPPKPSAIAMLTGEAPLAQDWNKENVPVNHKQQLKTGANMAPKLCLAGSNTPKHCLAGANTPKLSAAKRPLMSVSGSGGELNDSGFKIKRRKGLSDRTAMTLEDLDEDLGQSPMTFASTSSKVNKDFEASPNLVGPTASLRINETPKRKVDGKLATVSSPPTPVSSFVAPHPRPALNHSLQRSYSENVVRSCHFADSRKDLTGDFREPLALPLLKNGLKHQDLNTIDCHTMAQLIGGKFDDKVEKYRIIDARYVYEFVGGHIVKAENYGKWDEKMFFDEFLPDEWPTLPSVPHSPGFKIGAEEENKTEKKRSIIIFHCEFSSARGPALMKELRKRDRMKNKDSYPALYYPEIYLLHNGYKEFWECYPELCEPRSYQPMADPNYENEERMFRKKSKTWAAGGTVARTGSNSSRQIKF